MLCAAQLMRMFLDKLQIVITSIVISVIIITVILILYHKYNKYK